MRGDEMKDYWFKVREQLRDFRPGPNVRCEWYPCHFKGQDCSLCFCPLYPCHDERLGEFISGKDGSRIWSCKECFWPHRSDVARDIYARLGAPEERPSGEDLRRIKEEIEARHPVSAMPIMVLGATSGAGKSLLAAALCRIFSDMGYNVAPFKSQNMSLNSMVTPEGEEISRAQALQAAAARTVPDAHMNPILMKPKKDDISQIIVEGRPYRDMAVPEYFGGFTNGEGMEILRRNWELLRRTRDVVVIEGAGSPAEINLMDTEIANMRTAEVASAPCLLVVNIEWGGAFAYAYGTIMLLPPEQRRMFKGIIINNLYGDPASLQGGIKELEERLGIPVLGIVPHADHALPDEDSQDLRKVRGKGGLQVGVVHLPRIANFTDFDALALEGASVRFVKDPGALRGVDAVVIPGTKNTVADLKWLRGSGLFDAIRELKGKVPILGICGGYQMLGKEVIDLKGLEGDEKKAWEGLGLLDISTNFEAYEKRTVLVNGRMNAGNGGKVRGYEIHMGRSESREAPLFYLEENGKDRPEGAISPDGMVMGSYVHGMFDLPSFRSYFLGKAPGEGQRAEAEVDYEASVDQGLDRLAAVVRENLDMDKLVSILKEGLP